MDSQRSARAHSVPIRERSWWPPGFCSACDQRQPAPLHGSRRSKVQNILRERVERCARMRTPREERWGVTEITPHPGSVVCARYALAGRGLPGLAVDIDIDVDSGAPARRPRQPALAAHAAVTGKAD